LIHLCSAFLKKQLSNTQKIKTSALNTLHLEAQAVEHLTHFIDERFEAIVELLLASKGRLVVTGIGKSANIAQKLVATFISTGQPAVFMHAADAIHGDLGTIQKEDVVLCISKSGDSPEIKVLVPLIKSMGNVLVGMVSNMNGYLAVHSDHVLQTTVEKEACPNNLAPTTSTTAQLLMGDAIAVTLLQLRNFSAHDFSKFHPGGALGKQLYLTCGQLITTNSAPYTHTETPWKEVVLSITQSRLGATAVVNSNQEVIGIVTDGEIRRMLENFSNLDSITAKDIMGHKPTCLEENTLAVEAAQLMQQKKITQIPITKNNLYVGIVHLHDLYREGII